MPETIDKENCENEISVIMSVYNEKKEWLQMSINSILNQSFKNFEFIIVLDNPDNIELKAVLEEFAAKDSRIKLLYNKKNMGLVYSLNSALNVAKGEYIARMDADDISELDRLEVQYNYFKQNPSVDFVSGFIRIIDESDNAIEIHKCTYCSEKDIKINQASSNFFPHPTWMFKKKILNKLDKYNNVPLAEDYDFTCRALINNYNLCVIPRVLLNYRVRTTGISKSNSLKQTMIAETIRKSYFNSLLFKKPFNPYEKINSIKISEIQNKRFLKAQESYYFFVRKKDSIIIKIFRFVKNSNKYRNK